MMFRAPDGSYYIPTSENLRSSAMKFFETKRHEYVTVLTNEEQRSVEDMSKACHCQDEHIMKAMFECGKKMTVDELLIMIAKLY